MRLHITQFSKPVALHDAALSAAESEALVKLRLANKIELENQRAVEKSTTGAARVDLRTGPPIAHIT